MVEKLQPSPETNNAGGVVVGAAVLSLESDVKKAMSKSDVVLEGEHEKENEATRNGGGVTSDDTDCESESVRTTTEEATTTQGEEDEEEERVDNENDKEGNKRTADEEDESMVQQCSNSAKRKVVGGGDSNNDTMQSSKEQSNNNKGGSGNSDYPATTDARAKGENGRIVQNQRGTSSESSIKTTPDSSLETHSNYFNESSSEKVATINSGDNKQRPETAAKGDRSPGSSKLSKSQSNSTNSGGSVDPSQNDASLSRKTPTNSASASTTTTGKSKSVASANKDNDSSNIHKSPDSGPLNIRALPFESGINTECIQLLRQLWNVHDEAVEFLGCVHKALCSLRQWLRIEDNEYEETLWDKKRLSSTQQRGQHTHQHQQRRLPTTTAAAGGKLDGNVYGARGVGGVCAETGNELRWIPLQPFIDGLKCVSDNVSDIEKQCLTLSVFQSQCKLVLYAKVNIRKKEFSIKKLHSGMTFHVQKILLDHV